MPGASAPVDGAQGPTACERSQLPANHLAGTCKLGDETDTMAVVDRRLKVIGVRALRVADASVMPTLPSGNTHATCLMVGERTAALMLEDRFV
ncbi:GMC oxidoreductase-domain-containing protein [Pavlovales sp. CCMP2436]|nr:GMC oxidoreductase-domain-containing protein [Pavlovales sp. CCMP2436]